MTTILRIPAIPRSAPRRAARGVSLIELMTAITIGLLILAGLSSVFVNSSTANRELKNTAEQIENGRYAIEFLGREIRHAGFYGILSTLPAAPATAPDPCAAPTAVRIDTSSTTTSPLALPLQYVSAASIPGGCASLLSSANLAPNSGIVVVRRADTTILPVTSVTSYTFTAAAAGLAYLQTTANVVSLQYGAAANTAIDYTKDATGTVLDATDIMRLRPDTSVAAVGTPGVFPSIAAAIRQYHVHIYFVAPCSVGKGTGGVCDGSAGEDTIPTLKRLEMGAAGAFSISPIAEGIQAIRIEYGVDNSPSAADINTGLIGDSVPDSYTSTPSLADMSNTVAARIYVLARNTSPTTGYKDDKTYTMGGYTTTATNDTYKRHVYGAETRIANMAGRKEIPQ